VVTLQKAKNNQTSDHKARRKNKQFENLQGYGAQTAREGRHQSPYDEASGGDDLESERSKEKHKKKKYHQQRRPETNLRPKNEPRAMRRSNL
jgi:hypothetical protein